MSSAKTFSGKSEGHLNNCEDVAAYVDAAFEDGDLELRTRALGLRLTVTRA
jgi:DNA-binding phage protein